MLQRFLLTEIVTAEGKVAKDEGALNSAVVLKHLMLYSSINLWYFCLNQTESNEDIFLC